MATENSATKTLSPPLGPILAAIVFLFAFGSMALLQSCSSSPADDNGRITNKVDIAVLRYIVDDEFGTRDTACATSPGGCQTVYPCALCKQLSRSYGAFNRPERMTYDDITIIEFVLAPDQSRINPVDELSPELTGPKRVIKNIPTGYAMQAELDGGDNFEISPKGARTYAVLSNQSIKWQWLVTPKVYGDDLPLTLTISAILKQPDGKDTTASPVVIRERIPVDVRFFDRVAYWTARVDPIYQFLALIITALAGSATWLLARWRGEKPKEPLVVRIESPASSQSPQNASSRNEWKSYLDGDG